MRAGAMQLFSEPINTNALVAALGECISPKAKPRQRVLIVEDDESQAKLLADLLQKGALDTLAVTDPMGVFDAIWRFQPDLILVMDLYLPGADAIELTKLIRDREESMAIPILFLSGEDNLEKKLLALQAGADDFLTMPIRSQQLLVTMKSRIDRAKAISASGIRKSDDQASNLPARRALLSRLERIHINNQVGRDGYGLIVICMGDPQSDPIQWRGEDADRLIEAVVEGLGPLLYREDYLARITSCNLAILMHRPTRQALERLADLTYDSVNFKLKTSAAPGQRFGIGLALLDDITESANALLHYGETAASTAYRQALQGYLLHGAPVSPPDAESKIAKIAMTPQKQHFLSSLRSGLAALVERRFTCRTEKGHATQTLELIPQSTTPGSADDLYQTATSYEAAAEFNQFICHLGIQWLGEYLLQGKSVRLILRQSVVEIGVTDYIEFIKAELRRLQIVGTGLMMEFDLPSLASNLKRAHTLFAELATLGIGVSLSNFSCNETACKALLYLGADAIRPNRSLLGAETERIQQISRQIHSLEKEIILPIVEHQSEIAPQWFESADYIQTDFLQ